LTRGSSVTVNEEQAVASVAQGLKAADLTPSQALLQLYNGWVTTVSQLPGKGNQGDENFETLQSLMTGASFPGSPMLQTAFNDFYNNYDPMGYYHGLTGKYPATS
jgi:hypothetical protein